MTSLARGEGGEGGEEGEGEEGGRENEIFTASYSEVW